MPVLVPPSAAGLRRALAAVVALGLLLVGGCGSRPSSADDAGPSRAAGGAPWPAEVGRTGEPSPSQPSWNIAALGDSVATGGPCRCTPFPQLYGQDLARDRGARTHTRNLGVSGQTSGQLLGLLRDPRSADSRAVRDADIVLITIGANDFADRHDDVTSGRCLGDQHSRCIADDLGSMVRNVDAIVTAVYRLRAGHPTTVLVTGYWNVFEDGAVARRSFPDVGVSATRRLTHLANEGIHRATDTAGGTYVDLYAPFNGPESSGDTTRLLAADGDHPNAAGQALIARRLVAAGLPGLVRG